MLKIKIFFKGLLLRIPVTLLLQPICNLLEFIVFHNRLILFIYSCKGKLKVNDFYTPVREYSKREQVHQCMSDEYQLDTSAITYLEFGVCSGGSFKWWLANNKNADSTFWGFDTFEGLPEDWGSYNKGDLSSTVPHIDDSRGTFIKGLFQDTMTAFIEKERDTLQSDKRRVIHLDADLYSSTAFTLSQLYPFLKKGDVILFDEFNVARHEFRAYYEFTNNFYIKLTPLAAVNNFFQVGFVVE